MISEWCIHFLSASFQVLARLYCLAQLVYSFMKHQRLAYSHQLSHSPNHHHCFQRFDLDRLLLPKGSIKA